MANVCYLIIWFTAVLTYFGIYVLDARFDEKLPRFTVPRLIFIIAVATFMKKRGVIPPGLCWPWCYPVYEILATIFLCNVSLTLLWTQVESMIHLALLGLLGLIGLASGSDQGKDYELAEVILSSIVACVLLYWVLWSALSVAGIRRFFHQCIFKTPLKVSFNSTVQVREFNRTNFGSREKSPQSLSAKHKLSLG